MYSGSAQGVVERVINVRYYYYYYLIVFSGVVLDVTIACFAGGGGVGEGGRTTRLIKPKLYTCLLVDIASGPSYRFVRVIRDSRRVSLPCR